VLFLGHYLKGQIAGLSLWTGCDVFHSYLMIPLVLNCIATDLVLYGYLSDGQVMKRIMTTHGLVCLLMEMSVTSVMTQKIMTANEAAISCAPDPYVANLSAVPNHQHELGPPSRDELI